MTGAADSCALAGVGVLVTRPEGQSGALASRISAEGGRPILFPALQIEPVPEAEIATALEGIGAADLAVFVSPNAARFGLAALARKDRRGFAGRHAAVGPGTAAELKKAGVREVIAPESGFDSEALLAVLPLDEMAGRHVVIFRGNGGREHLGEVLQGRGARVTSVSCYRRVRPSGDMRGLEPLWRDGGIHACVATSAEIVTNLFAMAGETIRPWLCQTPIFVPHSRVATAAFASGARTLFVAGVGDPALMRGLSSWFAQRHPQARDDVANPP